MKEETLLKMAMDKWGFNSQRLIWIEEMAELIQSLTKLNRKVNAHSIARVEDEIADVDICLAQMKQTFPEWYLERQKKIDRLTKLVEAIE